ncbi:uncharacterized protein LOC62_03G003731 [Vanrija pseudolonga]|uniref:Uncharacterized protein n=1 Tax=Vanrija pseudolonga TaxID=143232 RepID=A0AAF1BQ26_9TREE|nr:hypothetical protein LOC62_03G003731 [Vanrija pseudolonga]
MPSPNLFFNWTFTDMDAVITYTPDNAGTGTPLWNTSYANSNWANYAPGQTGAGMSQHSAVATNTNNPGVAFNFLGTGYGLLGQISLPSNGALAVTQDGQQQSANAVSNTILSMGTGDYRYHKIQVALVDTANQANARPSISVTGLTVEYGFYSQAQSISNVNVRTESFVSQNGLRNTFYTVDGTTQAWNVSQSIGGANGQQPTQYPTLRGGNGSGLTFNVPANTSFIMLNGTVGPDQGVVHIVWTPPPPYQDVNYNLAVTNNAWQAPSVLYMGALDPAVSYSVAISADADGTAPVNKIGLASTSFWSAISASGAHPGAPSSSSINYTPSSGGSKTPVGAIVGGVVGGLAAIAAVVAAIFFLRRRKRHTNDFDNDKFEIEDGQAVTATPFISPGSGAGNTHNPALVASGAALGAAAAGAGAAAAMHHTGRTSESGTHATYDNYSSNAGAATSETGGSAAPILSEKQRMASQSGFSDRDVAQPLLGHQGYERQFSSSSSQAGYSSAYDDRRQSSVSGVTNYLSPDPSNPTRSQSGGSVFSDDDITSIGGSSSAAAAASGKSRRLPELPQSQVVVERDTGSAPAPAAPVIETLPPTYDPSWAQPPAGAPAGGAAAPLTEEPAEIATAAGSSAAAAAVEEQHGHVVHEQSSGSGAGTLPPGAFAPSSNEKN